MSLLREDGGKQSDADVEDDIVDEGDDYNDNDDGDDHGAPRSAREAKAFKRCLASIKKHRLEFLRGTKDSALRMMKVAGEYSRLLRMNWTCFEGTVNLLFLLMNENDAAALHVETDAVLQKVAADTFVKMAQKCARDFVKVHPSRAERSGSYMGQILTYLTARFDDFHTEEREAFFEGIGYMITSEVDDSQHVSLIERLMSIPNDIWDGNIRQIKANPDTLKDVERLEQFVFLLRINFRACTSLGNVYVHQLKRIFDDSLQLYKLLSSNISTAVSVGGDALVTGPLVSAMKAVKKEILRILSCWISKATDPSLVYEYFLPPMFEALLLDYKNNAPDAREPEVLSLLRAVVDRLESMVTPRIPEIFDGVFQCTLDMINTDFAEFSEHRTNFFLLLQSVNWRCFAGLLARSIIDSIVCACKQRTWNVAEIGLQILYQMLKNIASQPADVAQSFYKTYYLILLEHLFSVASDPTHSGNLSLFSMILAYMFTLVDDKKVVVALDPSVQPGAPFDNTAFLLQHLHHVLKTAFPHLTESQIKITIQGMFNLDQDVAQFKERLRDFLVQLKIVEPCSVAEAVTPVTETAGLEQVGGGGAAGDPVASLAVEGAALSDTAGSEPIPLEEGSALPHVSPGSATEEVGGGSAVMEPVASPAVAASIGRDENGRVLAGTKLRTKRAPKPRTKPASGPTAKRNRIN